MPAAEGHPVRVLIADDEPSVLNIVAITLRKNGFRVLGARCAEEVLEWYTRIDLAPQLQIIDVGLLEGSAVVLECIGRSDIPTIYTSGSLALAPDLPASNCFLQKPFTPAELLATVQRMLA